jgi:hypothetical protein
VTGIDLDQSFGTTEDPGNLADNGLPGRLDNGFRGVQLPPYVDTDMQNAVNNLSNEDLRSALTGLVSDAEINAAEKRLAVVKNHVATLQSRGNVLGNDEWQPDSLTSLAPQNSLWARGRED